MILPRRLAAAWFRRRFSRVGAGMCPADVEALVGEASETEQGQVPAGSGVGLQDVFAFKIAAGAPYVLWRYLRGDRTFIAVFARDGAVDGWRLSFRTNYPSAIDRR